MARKPRIHYPGAFYHVMLRGNGGQDIFSSDTDLIRFNLLLQEGVERYQHRIHAFCLMRNHVHLVIQVGQVSLSRIMQNVSFRYTRHFNKYQKRIGHLFQGRYKALLVDSDSYLVELVRYIHCNPIRSGIVSKLDDYSWSSHTAYLGKTVIPWLTKEIVLTQFAKNTNKAIKLYENFVQMGIAEKHRQEFHSGMCDGRILGNDSFSEKALSLAEKKSSRKITFSQIINAVVKEYGITERSLSEPGKTRLFAEARAVAAFLVQEEEHLSLTDLGKLLNRDLAALSRAASRIRDRLRVNSKLAKRVSSLREKIL
jgi:putative transposase